MSYLKKGHVHEDGYIWQIGCQNQIKMALEYVQYVAAAGLAQTVD